MKTPRSRTILAIVGIAVFVAFVVQESWAGAPVTVDSLIFFVIVGLTLGSIYAIAATGLVVTYSTSGVFNFAQGAIGMFMAFIYWELTNEVGIPAGIALLITVLVIAPIFGAVLEAAFMRRLRSAPLVAELVVTIGLMLFLMGLAATLWNPTTTRSISTFFGTDGFSIAGTYIPWYRVVTIVAGLGLALGLRLLLHRTRLGIAMRAVVDNPTLAAHNGAAPWVMSMTAWALGSSMAALAGIFLAEELSSVGIEPLTFLIIDAFGAAIIGRLKSLPLTYVGGMVIGLAISFELNFLEWAGRWTVAGASGGAIPTIILFLALLLLPQARIEGRRLGHRLLVSSAGLKRAATGFVILMAAVVVLAALLNRPDVRTVGVWLTAALLMLSLVPLTGWSGQISLAQVTFAGVGAWAAWEFSTAGGEIFGLGLFAPGNPALLLVGAAVAVPFGVLMALPALRLEGLYLGLASLAFARLAVFVFFNQPEVFGTTSRALPELHIFGIELSEPFKVLGISFSQDAGIVIAIAVMFSIIGMGVVVLRRGPYGRKLVAIRDSPAASATLGINLVRTKLSVFALSAAIAGFAGAIIGTFAGTAGIADFDVLPGLQYVVLAVVGGVSVVSGVILGGFQSALFPWLVAEFPGTQIFLWNQRLGPGFLGILFGRHPEGIVPAASMAREARRRPAAVKNGGASDAVQPSTSAPAGAVSTPQHD